MGTTNANLNFDIDFGHNIILKVIREIVASTDITNKI